MRSPASLRAQVLLFSMGLASVPLFAQAPMEVSTPVAAPVAMSVNYALLALAVFQVIVIVSMSGIMRTIGAPGKYPIKGSKRVGVMLLLFAGSTAVHAQGPQPAVLTSDQLFWWLVGANLFLFVVVLVQMNLMRLLTKTVLQQPEKVYVPGPDRDAWDMRLWKKLTNRVPVEREQDIMLDHDYDGIRELDNVLPPWWLWLFYGTVIWGVVYIVNVHVIGIWPHQQEEYAQEMARAKADVAAYMARASGQLDENNVAALTDPAAIAGGAAIFAQFCTPCHGKELEGKEALGPNLTDDHWKNGGGVKNIFRTITYGAGLGMQAWNKQLKPSEIQLLASFILSKYGSHPPNAKAPEGTIWTEPTPVDSVAPSADTLKLAATAP